eukprot:TRINITY_DN1401_c0_g4_i1.p1 TRINITY_DN1401_c0_g4~~TRINITY_DN1401_c0_g4_i1.p1  ORF type:complete len:232 (-),score=65.48 TRINITY_DN1401_c0_g4_i1:88-783(-)
MKLQSADQKRELLKRHTLDSIDKSPLNGSSVSNRPPISKSPITKIPAKSPQRKVDGGDKSPLRRVQNAASPTSKAGKVPGSNFPVKKPTAGESPTSKTGIEKKTSIKSKLEAPKSPTKRRVISYLDQVDELIVSTDANYFDIEIEELVIKKMQDKISLLNDTISSFTEDSKDLHSKIITLADKNKDLRQENGKLKERVKRIMSMAETQGAQFSGVLRCLKPNPGVIAFDDK